MPEPVIAFPAKNPGQALRNDEVCMYCGKYMPEGSGHICRECSDRLAPNGAKSKDNAIARYRHNIIRAAHHEPAKQLDMRTVITLNEIGLCQRLLDMQNADKSRDHAKQNELLRAIAETEVQLEILKAAHMKAAEDRDAYYFHLERAAKRQPQEIYNDDYAPLPLL